MKRVILCLFVALFALSACGGSAANTPLADPPNSTVYDPSGESHADTIIQSWKTAVPEAMTGSGVKADSIEQKVFQSTSSLSDVRTHYEALTSSGWTAASRMTTMETPDGTLLLGFESGTTDLVIGALDASKFGGTGVLVYTAKGSR